MKLSLIISGLLVGGLVVPGIQAAEAPSSAPSWIAQGDALYKERADLSANRTALASYEKAVSLNPRNAEAQWKAARAEWWVGTELTKKSEQQAYFNKGITYGKNSIALKPTSAEAHFWLGSNYASYGYSKGALTSLFLIKSIRKEMEEVLRLDPPYTAGGADRVLGILDYKIPGFMGGNKKRALEHLENALTYEPNHPVTLYYLAEYYDVMGRKDRAREYLQKISTLKPSPDFEPEFGVIQPQVEELRAKLIR